MFDLKPCPFCGSTKLKIERKQSRNVGRTATHTYSVRCNVCHARGSTVSGRIVKDPRTFCSQTPEWSMTDEVLEENAIEAWNRRINYD